MKRETNQTLAARYKVSDRTIKRWRKENAPLNDPAGMRAWIAGRKNIPPRIERTSAAQVPRRSMPKTDEREGVLAAQRRLERSEVEAFRAMEAAIQAGDAVAIRAARRGWIEINRELIRAVEITGQHVSDGMIPIARAVAAFSQAIETVRQDAGSIERRIGHFTTLQAKDERAAAEITYFLKSEERQIGKIACDNAYSAFLSVLRADAGPTARDFLELAGNGLQAIHRAMGDFADMVESEIESGRLTKELIASQRSQFAAAIERKFEELTQLKVKLEDESAISPLAAKQNAS